MKKYILTLGMATAMMTAAAATTHATPQGYADYMKAVNSRVLNTERRWATGAYEKTPGMRKLVQETVTDTDPISYWGSLFTPDGEQWMYSCEYIYEMVDEYSATISAADITVYDAGLKEYGHFRAEFQLEGNQTSINSVQVNPYLTKKFFNISDAYEVMVYVHATTDDYAGAEYTQAYSLADGSLITTLPGNNIAAVNTATDPWSEKFTLVFMRENVQVIPPADEDGYPEYSYMMSFDIYSKAGWGTGCKLEKTFDVDYQLIAGSGDYAFPILVKENKGHLYYALPHYEKPYFLNDWSEDITPDNNFIIELYNENFQLVRTTTIPMATEEGAYFSFPGIGELYGHDDVIIDDAGIPSYIVGVENYITSTDEFVTSLYIYDADGNRTSAIVQNVDDYLPMSPVSGQPDQWCFYFSDEETGGYFSMIDVPSGIERARIATVVDGYPISALIDRVPAGESYNYVSSVSIAETDAAGNALHKFAWFKDNGELLRYDTINLGQNIALGMPYVSAEAFDPYLFNTDSNIEYMFLVKELISPTSSKVRECLRVYNDKSELLLNLGPDEATGEVLNSIFLFNHQTNDPKLVVVYYGNDEYTIRHVDLPFALFAGGTGSVLDPYQIANAGDLMAMYNFPASNYVITSDLDFEGYAWHGNKCTFTGTLDGRGHTINNLVLDGSGIFSVLFNGATVKNLVIDAPVVRLSGDNTGIIANESMSDSKNPVLSNIIIKGAKVSGSAEAFGGLVGRCTVHTAIKECQMLDADVNIDHGSAGGIVGTATTGITIDASLVSGSIRASVAGGIIGGSISGDETVSNCHVSADIEGRSVAGGIIGESGRSIISHCLVEGSVKATGSSDAYAGGIAGSLAPVYNESEQTYVIENNISAAAVSANANAQRPIAHRIVGFTSIDERIVDWDNPNMDPSDRSTWTYLQGSVETDIRQNYAMGIAVIDSTIDDADTTTEGLSITVEELTDTFYAEHGWLFGQTVDAPWEKTEQLIALYYEDDNASGIVDAASRPGSVIKLAGSTLIAESEIEVYDTNGRLVARGIGSVDTSALRAGVYVARAQKSTLKFIRP